MKNVLFLFVVCAFVFASCSEEDEQDTVKPVIELEAPVTESVFQLGEEIHFEADFSDDVELKSYKIDIHDASGHSHTKSADATAWSFQKEFDISGNRNHHAHEHFDIPEDVKVGEYHFVVYCTDKAGNEQIAYVDIILE